MALYASVADRSVNLGLKVSTSLVNILDLLEFAWIYNSFNNSAGS